MMRTGGRRVRFVLQTEGCKFECQKLRGPVPLAYMSPKDIDLLIGRTEQEIIDSTATVA